MDDVYKLVFSFSFLFIVKTSSAVDIMNATQSIRDGEALVSPGRTFRLGFFSPGSSGKRYLGIWFNLLSDMTVVWVANREAPLDESSGPGVLEVTSKGTIVLLNSSRSIIWSSNASTWATKPILKILDSGNLIVKNEGDDDTEINFLWQSFDHPGNTLLPGMKLGRNTKTGLDRRLVSWKTTEDPSPGNYIYGVDLGGYPELVMRENGIEQYRPGPWNGISFSGTPQLTPNHIYRYEFVFNDQEIYYQYLLIDNSIVTKCVLSPTGLYQRFIISDQTTSWFLYLTSQVDNCDRYGLCGPYGSCNINNSPVCDCLEGFVPKKKDEWDKLKYSDGCVRKTALNCSGDGFRMYSGVKLPETRNSWYNKSMSLKDCENMCRINCSCSAYANSDIREEGSGCFLWFNDLIDMRELPVKGQVIYIRMAKSEIDLASIKAKSKGKKQRIVVIISSVLSATLLLGVACLVIWFSRKRQQNARKTNELQEGNCQDLPVFDLNTIATATNNFSVVNKLGEGGFGPVYKGILRGGHEIAVKRLSKDSRQGHNEFKNEVVHIAKLQHRNLVKLLGCCIEANETLLIYEFMPNKSLDFFIFDETRSRILNWPKRYHIINGIARGLLYLHQDSRLRIIHRDLKASNILLDYEMNPKISDFGLARSFGGNETEANTKKVVGTYGYMSPEYAIDGIYSVKSDVFGFGVMVLEIVSGKRNRGFYHPDHQLNLLGHTWKLHEEGRSLELVAEPARDSCNQSEMLKAVHIGLLCVQRSPEDRPTMSSVVLMLGGEGSLPQPKLPGYFNERDQ
ncbi:hypothetical protein K2173_003102 [Erythroxylum novogranatense]|uniref:Receptor-like serine/threonine-protein kinase n=1 Tax=Erythroxylum novogranatense TaxID=1862640 RepID=A0AAV8TA84_9ROSI|nr:hypothetical protein K2173_003102 [Erythroxylum novogranatense]